MRNALAVPLIGILLSGCSAFLPYEGEQVYYASDDKLEKVSPYDAEYSENGSTQAFLLSGYNIEEDVDRYWTFHGYKNNKKACEKDMNARVRHWGDHWKWECSALPYRDEAETESASD